MERVTTTTPAREIERIDHRIAYIEVANRERFIPSRENLAELQRLRMQRHMWQWEADELREAHIAHAARMVRVHAGIARDHLLRWETLVEDARREEVT